MLTFVLSLLDKHAGNVGLEVAGKHDPAVMLTACYAHGRLLCAAAVGSAIGDMVDEKCYCSCSIRH